MERSSRIRLFAICSALAAVVVVLISSTSDDPPPDDRGERASGRSPAPGAEPPSAPGLREASGAHLEDHAGDETPPALAVIEASRAGRPEVRPVVGRFVAAFSAYELGRLNRRIRAEIRATATRAFARELLAAPPRIPLGVPAPPHARIRKVEIFLAPDAAEGTATVLIERDGKAARTTYLLRRTEDGWRVSALLS